MDVSFLSAAGLPNPHKSSAGAPNGGTGSRSCGFVGSPEGIDLTPSVELCEKIYSGSVVRAAVDIKAGLILTAPVSFSSPDYELTDTFQALLQREWTPTIRNAVRWMSCTGFVPITFKTVGMHRVPTVVQQGAYNYRMFHDSQGQPYILAFYKTSASGAVGGTHNSLAAENAFRVIMQHAEGGGGGVGGAGGDGPLQDGMPELSSPAGMSPGMADYASHVYVHIFDAPSVDGTLSSAVMSLAPDFYYLEAARRHHLKANATSCIPPIFTQLSQSPAVAQQLGSAILGGDRVASLRTRRAARRQGGQTSVVSDTAAFHILRVAETQRSLGRLAGNVRVTQRHFAPPIDVSRGTLASRIIPLPANQTSGRSVHGVFHGDMVAFMDAFSDSVAKHLGLPVEILRPQAGRHSSESNSHNLLRRTLRGSRRTLEGLMSVLFDAIYGDHMRQTGAADYMRRYGVCVSAVQRYLQELDMRVLARTAANVNAVVRDRTGGGAGTTSSDVGAEKADERAAREKLTDFLLHSDGQNALALSVMSNGFNTMMNSLASSPTLHGLSKDNRYQVSLLKLLTKAMKRATKRTSLSTRFKILPDILTGADMNAPEVLITVAGGGAGADAGAGRRVGSKTGFGAGGKAGDKSREGAYAAGTEEVARQEAEVALDTHVIRQFGDPAGGMPFQPEGYAERAKAIQSSVREKVHAVEMAHRVSEGRGRGGGSSAEHKRVLNEAIAEISRVMQDEMMTAFEEAGKGTLSAFLDNFKIVPSIHDTDPSQNIFTMYEAGILTPDALRIRVAHQTGFGVTELEVRPPAETLALRNGKVMQTVMKKFGVDARTALVLMGMGGGGGGGGGSGSGSGDVGNRTKADGRSEEGKKETDDSGEEDDIDRREKRRAAFRRRKRRHGADLSGSDRLSLGVLMCGKKHGRVCFKNPMPREEARAPVHAPGVDFCSVPVEREGSASASGRWESWISDVRRRRKTVVVKVVKQALFMDTQEISITNLVRASGGAGPQLLAYAVVQYASHIDVCRAFSCRSFPDTSAGRGASAAGADAGGAVPSSAGANIAKLGDAPVTMVMVMEEGPQTLRSFLSNSGPVTASEVLRAIHSVSDAVSGLLERGVMHRDIKGDNILYDRVSGRATVVDFGTSAVTRVSPASGCGSGYESDATTVVAADAEEGEGEGGDDAGAGAGAGAGTLRSRAVPMPKAASTRGMFAQAFRPPEVVVSELAAVGGDGRTYRGEAHAWAVGAMFYFLLANEHVSDASTYYREPEVTMLPPRARSGSTAEVCRRREQLRTVECLVDQLFQCSSLLRQALPAQWLRVIEPSTRRLCPRWGSALRSAHTTRRAKGTPPPPKGGVVDESLILSVLAPCEGEADRRAVVEIVRFLKGCLVLLPEHRLSLSAWTRQSRDRISATGRRKRGREGESGSGSEDPAPLAGVRPGPQLGPRPRKVARHALGLDPVAATTERLQWVLHVAPGSVPRSSGMLMQPHRISVKMRAVLVNDLFRLTRDVVRERREMHGVPSTGCLTHAVFANAVILLDAVFPLATCAESGTAKWSCPLPRKRPGAVGRSSGGRRHLRTLAGTARAPDASALELKDGEIRMLVEMCLHTAMAMAGTNIYASYVTDCMLRADTMSSPWAKGTLRRDLVIRFAHVVGEAFSAPRRRVARVGACREGEGKAKARSAVRCTCGEKNRRAFTYTASLPADAPSVASACSRGVRTQYSEPPMWTFAFLALLALDPSLDLREDVCLPCVRCRAAFRLPKLQTLSDLMSRVYMSSIGDILSGLQPVCKWSRKAKRPVARRG